MCDAMHCYIPVCQELVTAAAALAAPDFTAAVSVLLAPIPSLRLSLRTFFHVYLFFFLLSAKPALLSITSTFPKMAIFTLSTSIYLSNFIEDIK